jgi:glycosyltransferase involved in cell wall biosynthesis
MNVVRSAAPRLSIGMPVYNGANYVADAIQSILAQTFTDFELIVSDNASTDETPEIVASFVRNDPRVRFVRNARNMGASYNFNQTFALARGAYFRQAAHDDTLAPTCVERCVEVLDADPSVSLAYTRSLCIDESGNVLAEYANVMHFAGDDPVERFRAHLRRAFDRTPEANRGNNPACNPIFGIARTAMLATTPMVANYMASDMILLGELALRGKIYEVPEVLFFIRAHPSTSWANNPGLLDVAAWFDPANRSRVISYMPHVRWFYEYLRAIQRAPLRPDQRAACIGILLGWAAEHRSEIARESLSVGARFAGLRAWAGASGRRIGPPPRPVGL